MATILWAVAGAVTLITWVGYGLIRFTMAGWPDRPLARLHWRVTHRRLPHITERPGLELSDYTNVLHALQAFWRWQRSQQDHKKGSSS